MATLLGRRLIRGTVYDLKLTRRGVDWEAARRPRLLARRNVASIEREIAVIARAGEPVAEAAKRIDAKTDGAIPVLRDGRFVGIVPFGELIENMRTSPLAPIENIARKTPTLSPEDSFERAATLLADPLLPAVAVEDPKTGRFIGIVTRRDVLEAYRNAVRL